ncbi:hypothetical protein OROMI_003115 [Orobanche minor]
MKPAVRIKFPPVIFDVITHCIVNSTVYIFGGYNSYTLTPCLEKKKKSAYKHVLSPEDLVSAAAVVKVLEGEQLTSIPDMTHGKGFPDGKKILVFSRCFIFKESFEAFELLNVDDDSWETLPGLPCINCSLSADSNTRRTWCNCTSDGFVHVRAFSFIGKGKSAVFSLQTDDGAFSLDLGSNEWISLDVLLVAPTDDETNYGYLGTFKGRYVIMPGPKPVYKDDGTPVSGSDPTLRVYDFGDNGLFYPIREDAPHEPADVIQLSHFDPPRDSLWLEPLNPIVFPLRPQDEETACCFVVQQLKAM